MRLRHDTPSLDLSLIPDSFSKTILILLILLPTPYIDNPRTHNPSFRVTPLYDHAVLV